jgi:hypothetical protein
MRLTVLKIHSPWKGVEREVEIRPIFGWELDSRMDLEVTYDFLFRIIIILSLF